MASIHKKIALSVAASQELERLEKKKAKINNKVATLKSKYNALIPIEISRIFFMFSGFFKNGGKK